MINKDEITEALFVALSGYIKEAYLEGYDNALLNKKTGENPEQLFKDSNVKKQVELIIQHFAAKDIPIPENYVPCPYCLRLTHVTQRCGCKPAK